MTDVLLCYSNADGEAAAAIAARLESAAEVRVSLEASDARADRSVASTWEMGGYSSGIVLLLSPDSVPPFSRTVWEPLLEHLKHNAAPPVAAILVRDCRYPPLLERKNFFRWEGGTANVLRALQRWAIGLHPEAEQPSISLDPLPWFEQREDEMDCLWQTLADGPGAAVLAGPAGSGKTSLAQEFARRAAEHFRDVLWVECGDRSQASIDGEIAGLLGVRPGTPEVWELLGEHRLLLVLDDLVAGDAAPLAPLAPGGRASVLVTTRSAGLEPPPGACLLRLKQVTVPPLAFPADPLDARLWQAMSLCSPRGVPLELAARIAGASDAGAAGERLVSARLADPFVNGWRRYRLSAASRDLAQSGGGLDALRRRHAQVLREMLVAWRTDALSCRWARAEIRPALDWASANDWPLAVDLGRRAFRFLEANRPVECAEAMRRLLRAAEERQDRRIADECVNQLYWLEASRPFGNPEQLDLFD